MATDPEQLLSLIRERRKIEAIKLLREADGLGLKQAKDQVEELERQLAASDPTFQIKRAGCAALLLIGLGAVGITFALLV